MEDDRKIYNYVDFNYHINNFKLKRICDALSITMKEYYDVCRRLEMPRTTQKILRKVDDELHFDLIV